jgi:hypothetical protein
MLTISSANDLTVSSLSGLTFLRPLSFSYAHRPFLNALPMVRAPHPSMLHRSHSSAPDLAPSQSSRDGGTTSSCDRDRDPWSGPSAYHDRSVPCPARFYAMTTRSCPCHLESDHSGRSASDRGHVHLVTDCHSRSPSPRGPCFPHPPSICP